MTARLIALCSPAMGSGKSTVAARLTSRFGYEKLAFAGALKAMTVALLTAARLPEHEIRARVFGDRKEEPIAALGGATSRWVQQSLGTEWGRDLIHPQLWVGVTMAAATMLLDRGVSVVIDDMRFPNEFDAVRAAGGECYRIVRSDAEMTTAAHPSEGQLDRIDMPQIVNDGSIAELMARIDHLLALR